MLPWLVGKVFKCVCLGKTLAPLHPTYHNFTKRQTNTNLTLDPWIAHTQTPTHLCGPLCKVFPQVQTVRRNWWCSMVEARPVSLTSAKGAGWRGSTVDQGEGWRGGERAGLSRPWWQWCGGMFGTGSQLCRPPEDSARTGILKLMNQDGDTYKLVKMGNSWRKELE